LGIWFDDTEDVFAGGIDVLVTGPFLIFGNIDSLGILGRGGGDDSFLVTLGRGRGGDSFLVTLGREGGKSTSGFFGKLRSLGFVLLGGCDSILRFFVPDREEDS